MENYIDVSQVKQAYNLNIENCENLIIKFNASSSILSRDEIDNTKIFEYSMEKAEDMLSSLLLEVMRGNKLEEKEVRKRIEGMFTGYIKFGNAEYATTMRNSFWKDINTYLKDEKWHKLVIAKLAKAIQILNICYFELPKKEAILYLNENGYSQIKEVQGLSFEYVKTVIKDYNKAKKTIGNTNIETSKALEGKETRRIFDLKEKEYLEKINNGQYVDAPTKKGLMKDVQDELGKQGLKIHVAEYNDKWRKAKFPKYKGRPEQF